MGGQIIASKRFPNPDEVGSPFSNKYYFYNYDIRGSVTNIVGPDGNLVTGYGYDEFGNQERKGDTSFLNEVTFTGSISDTSTGLQYMNARFYQPTTGRFISQDSYTGNAYDPWTQNLYAYCGNNPTNFVDPTGHSALDIIKKISATNNKLAALRKDRAKCVIPPYVSNDVANIIKERAKNLDIMIHSTDIYRRTLYRELADENKKKPAGPIHPAKPKEEPKGTTGEPKQDVLENDPDFNNSGFVNNQSELNAISFGTHGTAPGNCCGAIAAHNANLLLGEKSNFSDVYKYFDDDSKLILNGKAGTNPFSVAEYFKNKGYKVEGGFGFGSMEEYKAIIMIYVWATPDNNGGISRMGVHYMAGTVASFGPETSFLATFNPVYAENEYSKVAEKQNMVLLYNIGIN